MNKKITAIALLLSIMMVAVINVQADESPDCQKIYFGSGDTINYCSDGATVLRASVLDEKNQADEPSLLTLLGGV